MKYKFDNTQPFCSTIVTSNTNALYFSADPIFRYEEDDFKSSDPEYPDEREMPMVAVAFAATCVSALHVFLCPNLQY